ncbi:MAG: hypothetical protein GY835_15875 [bacterium]|nr:hypothetical protein [bacterium]
MERHLTVLGALYLVISVFGLLFSLVIFVTMTGGGLLSGDQEALIVTTSVGTIISSFLTLLSLPGLIIGFGLLRLRPWARSAGVVLSILNLLSIPFGTIVGIYGLVTLLKPEAAEFLAEKERIRRGQS